MNPQKLRAEQFAREFQKIVDSLFYDADDQLIWRIQDDPKKIKLSMPLLLFEDMCYNARLIINHPHYLAENKYCYSPLGFCNVEVIPANEMAISLFHVDYPIFREDWMEQKILLMDSEKNISPEGFEEFKILIEDFIKMKY